LDKLDEYDNNNSQITTNKNDITNIKGVNNSQTTEINLLKNRTTLLESYIPEFIQINLTSIDILGVNMPNGQNVSIEHQFNIGKWIYQNTNWGCFNGNGVWNYTNTALEISMSFKLSGHNSWLYRCQSGLRNYLYNPDSSQGAPPDGGEIVLPEEHNSTLEYIDCGIHSSRVDHYISYRYSNPSYIISNGGNLSGNYVLWLKTHIHLQTSTISTKDLIGVLTIKKLR